MREVSIHFLISWSALQKASHSDILYWDRCMGLGFCPEFIICGLVLATGQVAVTFMYHLTLSLPGRTCLLLSCSL